MTLQVISKVPAQAPSKNYGGRLKKLLTREEEFDLAVAWREHGDYNARTKLFISHLPLADRAASKRVKWGHSFEDLQTVSRIGLLQGVDRFEPSKGWRLATYAIYWIEAELKDHVLHNVPSGVKFATNADNKNLFFNLSHVKKNLGLEGHTDLAPADAAKIAELMQVPEAKVNAINRLLIGGTSSTNILVGSGSGSMEIGDLMATTDASPEERAITFSEANYRHQLLSAAMQVLEPRNREIFMSRRLSEDPPTLVELSQRYGVTVQRVQQIEEHAFEMVQKEVLRRVKDPNAPARVRKIKLTPPQLEVV